MELELGIKLARVADEFISADFQIAKDRAGPLFLSRETDTLFILTAHLKGYKKRNIKIEINEDGTRIVMCGEKAIQETVVVGWKLYKKETKIKGFRKAFKIPEGVILDKIRGKFDEDESILTISMPKKEKGIRGFIVEEVKEHELARGGSETLRVAVDHEFPPEHTLEEGTSKAPEIASVEEPKDSLERMDSEEIRRGNIHDVKGVAEKTDESGDTGRLEKGQQEEHETGMTEGTKHLQDEVSTEASTAEAPVVENRVNADKIPQGESGMHEKGELEKEKNSQEIQGKMEREHDENARKNDQVQEEVEDEEESAMVKPPEGSQEHRPSSDEEEKGRCKICTPIVAGSALLLSLVVFVIHFIRTKSQSGKRKD